MRPLRPSTRVLFLLAGWICLCLGALALILPVIPTSPFLLLALWLFSRGSPRFRHWLSTTPWLEPVRRQWHKFRDTHKPLTTGQWIGLILALVSAYLLLTLLVIWAAKRVPWSILFPFL